MSDEAPSLERILSTPELESGRSLGYVDPEGHFRVSVRALSDYEEGSDIATMRIEPPANVADAVPHEPARSLTLRLDRPAPYPIYFAARPEEVWTPERVGFVRSCFRRLWGGVFWLRIGAFLVGSTTPSELEQARMDTLTRYGDPFTTGDAEFDRRAFCHSAHASETLRRLQDNDALPGLQRMLTTNAPFGTYIFFGIDEVALTTTATDRISEALIDSWVGELALLRELLTSD